MLIGIAVRRHNGEEDPTLVQAALRAAFGLTYAPLWIVGLLAILWDPKRRAWHDKVFRTVVPLCEAGGGRPSRSTPGRR